MDLKQRTIFILAIIKCALEATEAQNATNLTVTEIPGIHGVSNVTAQTPRPQDLTNKTVAGSFVANHIVPDIIPVAPTSRADITYPNGKKATLGNKLTPTQVRYIPYVTWNSNSSQYYTLIAIDPDLPSRQIPVYRSTLHWCVVNIRGTNITSGTTTAEYIGAVPPAGTGLHRFIFLVYQQPGLIFFNLAKINDTTSVGRHRFSVEDFAMKYNLSDPVAGNFFQTSFDNYVPVLYNLLGYSKAHALTPDTLFIPASVAIIIWQILAI